MKRIVFAGAGHANIVALRSLARARSRAALVLVNDGPYAWYTGALPALIRGDIGKASARIDLPALAAACGATFVQARTCSFDDHRLNLQNQATLPFDYLVLSTGSTKLAGGVKPIPEFLQRIAAMDRLASPHIGIIGGGAAGSELALALRHRLGSAARITIEAGKILPHAPSRARHLAEQALAAANIMVVTKLQETCDDIIHAYTPVPALQIRNTLQLAANNDVFAAGDIAALPQPLPRSGAIAVRQGRLLAVNLQRAMAGRRLQAFQPPSHILAIMSIKKDEALAWYGNWTMRGRIPAFVKQRLDGRWTKT